jgi:hypothetical protein
MSRTMPVSDRRCPWGLSACGTYVAWPMIMPRLGSSFWRRFHGFLAAQLFVGAQLRSVSGVSFTPSGVPYRRSAGKPRG